MHELEKINDEEYNFISTISHNIFTPLTAIKGYSSLLLEGSFGEISDEYEEKAKKIFDSSQNFVKIVRKFLNISITKEPLFYKFTSEERGKEELKELPKSPERVDLFKKRRSEFVQLSSGQFLDLSEEINKDIIELREISSGETNEKVTNAIQKISGSGEDLIKTIKDFNEVLKIKKDQF